MFRPLFYCSGTIHPLWKKHPWAERGAHILAAPRHFLYQATYTWTLGEPKSTSTLDFQSPPPSGNGSQERQHVYLLAAAISIHLHQADGGPVHRILQPLSSLITLVRHHISLLECRDKKVWEHAAPVTLVIWKTGFNQLQVALVPVTHPCRLSSFICTT